MKKTIVIVLICSVLFIISILLFTKIYLLDMYHIDDINLNNDNIFKEEITVQTNKNIDYDEYNFNSLYFRNDFSDYEISQEEINNSDTISLFKRDEQESITIYKHKQLSNMLIEKNFVMRSPEEYIFNDEDRVEFLQKNNIKNDIDLLNYVKDNYYLKNNIFMSDKQMKENYMINLLTMGIFSNGEKSEMVDTKLIKGDLLGFIVDKGYLKDIFISDGDDEYINELYGDGLTNNNYVNDFLKTIRIDHSDK